MSNINSATLRTLPIPTTLNNISTLVLHYTLNKLERINDGKNHGQRFFTALQQVWQDFTCIYSPAQFKSVQ